MPRVFISVPNCTLSFLSLIKMASPVYLYVSASGHYEVSDLEIRQKLNLMVDSRLKSLKQAFRQKFKEKVDVSGKLYQPTKKQTNSLVDNDELPWHTEDYGQYEIPPCRIDARGALIDISKLSRMSSLTLSFDSESHFKFLREASHFEGLSVCKLEWWDRPFWAWTFHELVLSSAALFGLEVWNELNKQVSVTASTDPLIAELSCLWKSECNSNGMLLVIDDQQDRDFIRARLSAVPNDDVNAHHLEALRRKYQVHRELQQNLLKELDWVTKGSASSMEVPLETSQCPAIPTPIASSAGAGNNGRGPIEEASMTAFSKSSKYEDEVVRVVSPQSYRRTPSMSEERKVPPTSPSSPQIDSHGIDVTILSQLPPSIRTEARFVVMINNARNKSGPLRRWMVEKSSLVRKPFHLRVNPSKAVAVAKLKRKRTGIETFFPSKR
jgi:hypothetical protein